MSLHFENGEAGLRYPLHEMELFVTIAGGYKPLNIAILRLHLRCCRGPRYTPGNQFLFQLLWFIFFISEFFFKKQKKMICLRKFISFYFSEPLKRFSSTMMKVISKKCKLLLYTTLLIIYCKSP